MSKPLIAIVGRPNVGKSMLFNKIIGRRLSIVEDTPGVTRDRIYGESDWNGRKFTLVDTGGIEPSTDNQILAFMRQQAQIAIDNATVIVLVTRHQDRHDRRRPGGGRNAPAVQKAHRSGSEQDGLHRRQRTRSSMSSTTWVWATPSPCPPSTVTAPATCWTPACSTSRRRTDEEEDERRDPGGHHRQAQRGQVQPHQPHPGGAAGHRQRCGRHHPGRHRQLF